MTYLELGKLIAGLPLELINTEVQGRVEGIDGYKLYEIAIACENPGSDETESKMKVILEF